MWLLLAPALAAPFPAHDAAFKSGARAPEDAAVVIGIESYFALPAVAHADRDASAVKDLLIYTLGIPSDRVERVADPASKERIEAAVGRASELVGPSGTLWIYFAGHGAASPTGGERLLLGVDTLADAGSFDARSISIPSLKAQTKGAGARTVLMVDACYSGASREGADLLPGKRFAVPSYATPAESSWVEWHAAQPDQLSGPLDIARHGAFTWAMVGALRGWADGQIDDEPDGVVTAEEAELYVEELLRTVGITDQQPVLEAKDPQVALRTAEKLEPRPDADALRVLVETFVPAPAGGPPVAVVAQPAVAAPKQAPTGWGVCSDPARFSQWDRYQWFHNPSNRDHDIWMCDGGSPNSSSNDLYLHQLAPEAGLSSDELRVKALAPYPAFTTELRKQKTLSVAGDGVDPHDVSTWESVSLTSPSGPVTARRATLHYYQSRSMFHFQTLLTVEDPRQPGSLFVCRTNPAPANVKVQKQQCPQMLEGMLRGERW